jgi:hypothetical protein
LELHGCYIGNDSDGQQENIFGGKYILRRWRKDCGRRCPSSKFQGSSFKETSKASVLSIDSRGGRMTTPDLALGA